MAGGGEGGCRQVEDGEVLVATGEQVVDEGGGAAPDVDDRCVRSDAKGIEQGEGHSGLFLVPRHRLGTDGGVAVVPVRSVGLHRSNRMPSLRSARADRLAGQFGQALGERVPGDDPRVTVATVDRAWGNPPGDLDQRSHAHHRLVPRQRLITAVV